MACRNSLFGSTEHAEVKDSRQVDRLLSHDRPSKSNSTQCQLTPFIGLVDQPVQDLLRCAKQLFVAAMVARVHPEPAAYWQFRT